jgi:4-amino-4-deoxy-L-arabinose transferase-like glycosyltransferase
MDDVDAVQAQIARTMLESGDWVTARLDGVVYLEKSPFVYWMMAASFKIFGVTDWAARLPLMLATMALCWTTQRFTAWAFGERAGFYAGLVMATSLGLFLFTRILIPDSTLTLTIALSMWAFLRTQDDDEPHPGRWSVVLGVGMALGILLKGLIAAVFPAAAIFLYWAISGKLFDREAWRRVRPVSTAAIMLAVAAPWFILATLRNPPYFDFSMTSGPGNYRGFFWFYFFNEHILRFLNRRYPRDYNTVPRLWFWASHLAWFFPWSVFLGNLFKLDFTRRPTDRAGRATLLALCWIGFVMVFFSLSTTQEYYSLPIYPAVAMLVGVALTRGGRVVTVGKWMTSVLAGAGALAIGLILFYVRNVPTPGDIAQALKKSTEVYDVYTLSLGHMGDLTLGSFAYLRLPLVLAGVACLVGAIGVHLKFRKIAGDHQPFLAIALMLTLFLTAARVAMVGFDPYLGSRPLAEALIETLPKRPGTVVMDNQFYAFSSVFFYANPKNALLLNGRTTNLEYGSNAPGGIVKNGRGVEAAAQPDAERHVGEQMLAHRLAEQPVEFPFGVGNRH